MLRVHQENVIAWADYKNGTKETSTVVIIWHAVDQSETENYTRKNLGKSCMQLVCNETRSYLISDTKNISCES
jgi:hypothetical protein